MNLERPDRVTARRARSRPRRRASGAPAGGPSNGPRGGVDDGDLDDLRSDPDPTETPRRHRPDEKPCPRLDPSKRDDYYRDRRRRKVCAFCADKTVLIDYKEVNRLRRYLSERAKIEPRRKTGTCAAHQRELAVALKRARIVALLPYAPQHLRAPDGACQESRGARPPMRQA